MASSSSLSDKGTHGRSVLEPPGEKRKAEQSARSYNVFINHRGPDVKETLALHLYNSLDKVGIRAFLDQEEKEPGVLFPSTIKTAIQSAKVQIAIFSKGYAESPWCLEELLLMLKTDVKIIPLFYEVQPWELRHLEKGSYNQAFKNYEEKSRYTEKLEEWKEALNRMSYVAGYIIRELPAADECKQVVAAVQNEMETIDYLNVKKYSKLIEELECWCLDHLLPDVESNITDCLEDLEIHVSDRLQDLAGEYGINEDENWSLKRWCLNHLLPDLETRITETLEDMESRLDKKIEKWERKCDSECGIDGNRWLLCLVRELDSKYDIGSRLDKWLSKD